MTPAPTHADGIASPGPENPSRSAGIPGRELAVLVALAGSFAAAFVLAPRLLAGSRPGGGFFDQGSLVEAVRVAFVEYWGSGERTFSPGLESVVDYWIRYHLAKAVIAAILLTVLVALGVLLWKAFLRAGGLGAAQRGALASAGVVVSMLALFSLVLVMANVQGAVAPLSSLVSMLPVGETDGALAETLGQVRQQLADPLSAGDQSTPALDVMVSDFSRYHLAMAVIAAVAAAVLVGLGVLFWRWFAATESSDRATRRVLGTFGILSALVSLGLLVVAVANTTTAANPVPALLAFFNGGL